MKILVTGAKGFVGKNLCAELRNIKDGKSRCWGDVVIDEVFEYDVDSTSEELDEWCKECELVFNLAGVNRPQNQEEFMEGNFGFASTLLDSLKKHGNACPVMLSSSQQASLTGRFLSRNFCILQSVVKSVSIFLNRESRRGNIGITPSGSFSLLLLGMD